MSLPRPANGVPESLIHEQLERILASDTFSRSDRLSRFLRFTVEQTLEGHGAGLKEQFIACKLYGKGADFDTASSAVVRVDARRLRDKLREYYAEHTRDSVLITLPKGAYVPLFERILAAPADEHVSARQRTWGWKTVAVSASAVVIVVSAIAWITSHSPVEPEPKLVPLTSYPGNLSQPALSPDGTMVAFSCSDGVQTDICVKAVGSETFQHLTSTPESEFWPAWSPNGQEIAFGRGPRPTTPGFQDFGTEMGIYIISRQGGAERKVSSSGAIAGWMPDGKSLLIRERLKGQPYAIFQVDLGSLERRQLTRPPAGDGDWRFDVSPSGVTLAFIRFARTGAGDLFVMPIRGGEPRRLTDWNRYLTGVAWMPNGKELIYSVDGRLWRIPAAPGRPGRGSPVPDIPMSAAGLSISRPGAGRPARLAFRTGRSGVNLRRVDLSAPVEGGQVKAVQAFAPATRTDSPGRFSPDGSKVAFVSNRNSLNPELWVANCDGGQLRQITSLGTASRMLAGSWSPNSQRIAFDAEIDGKVEVYIVSAEGGKPTRLTTGSSIDALPEWSTDGRWIYYASTASGSVPNIWRIPAEGGKAEQLTTEGGFEPQESPDGRYLYYVDRPPSAGSARLMRVAAAGGNASVLFEGVTPLLWAVTNHGIYFLRQEHPVHAVYLYQFASQATARIGALPFLVARLQTPGRFTVSRDGRWGLMNVVEESRGDLMLLDNFH